LSKETGALFLFAILIHAGFFRRAEVGRLALAAVAGIGIYFLLRAGVAGLLAVDHQSSQIARADFFERLPTVPVVVALYLVKFVFPFGLSTNQDWVYSSFLALPPVAASLGIFLLVGLALFFLKGAKDKKTPLFWMLWLLLGLGLHSQFLNPLDGTFAERWAYFPLFGFIGLSVWLGRNLSGLRPAFGAVILVLVYGVTAHQRSLDWKDDYTLATKDVRTDPASPFTQNNMGVELYRRGEYKKALEHLEKSVELNPKWNISRNNIGATLLMLDDIDGAATHLKASLDLGPTLLALRNYPIVLAKQGKREEAIQFTETQSLKAFPQDQLIRQIYSNLKSGEAF
jgi:tetratricopeptide (TPR) repeat protein